MLHWCVCASRRTSSTVEVVSSAAAQPDDSSQQVAVVLHGLQSVHRCLQCLQCILSGGCWQFFCRTENPGLQGMGPRRALKVLALVQKSAVERSAWLEQARLDAIVGSCKGSLGSVKSGVRCYVAIVEDSVGGTPVFFPPKLEWVLAWAKLFRCKRTFSNYVGYVKTACLLVKADVAVFEHPAVARAKVAVEKSTRFEARSKLWIQRHLVEAMLAWCSVHGEKLRFAHLFLLSYSFLLRVPSEAIPVVAGRGRAIDGAQAVLSRDGNELVLVLRTRKNKRLGSRLVRGCWCRECAATCPVHVLGPLVDNITEGEPLFGQITAALALKALRTLLVALEVQDAGAYRTHDLRRGHALDLQLSGAPLWQILQAGEWRSPAFLQYLDLHRLDRDLVVQAHLDEESDDEV